MNKKKKKENKRTKTKNDNPGGDPIKSEVDGGVVWQYFQWQNFENSAFWGVSYAFISIGGPP